MLSDITHILKIIEKIYCCKYVVINVILDLVYAWKSVSKGLELVGMCLVYFLLVCLVCSIEVR